MKKKRLLDVTLRDQRLGSNRLVDLVNCMISEHECESLEVIYTQELKTSALYGFMAPKLLVSNQLDRLSDNEIRMIVTHELIHYRKKHHLVNGLLFGLCAIYWFHPLLPVMTQKLKHDMELYTDAMVMKVTACSGKEYGYLLLSAHVDQSHVYLGAFKNSSGMRDMKERMDGLMQRKQFKGIIGVVVVFALMVGGFFLTKPKGIKMSERIISVPIVIENIADHLTVENDFTGSMLVTVKGEEAAIEILSGADFWASVDGSDLGLYDEFVQLEVKVIQRFEDDSYTFSFTPTMVTLTNTTDDAIIQKVEETAKYNKNAEPLVSGYIVPIDNATVTCEYWCYSGHTGIDLINSVDSNGPIYATADGVVIESDYHSINGYFIFIDHGNDVVSKYLHMNEASPLAVGTEVKQGEIIGVIGKTGLATGPHLAFYIEVNKERVNPRTFIPLPKP